MINLQRSGRPFQTIASDSCEDREFKRWHWCFLTGLDSLFQETPIITPKKTNRPATRRIWRYVLLLRRSSTLWNLKTSCRVQSHSLFVRYLPSSAIWRQAHSEECFFQLLIAESTVRFTGEKRIGVWKCHASCSHRKTTVVTSTVYGWNAKIIKPKNMGSVWFTKMFD